jgi:hypothetical protein
MSDDEPVWDGRGRDPWLPDRVAALLDAAAEQARVFADYWRRLREWLADVLARLRAERFDPMAIPAMIPAWRESVDAFATGTLLDVMRRGYRAVTGEDFTVDAEQNALNRAWSRRNQLVNVADEVYVRVQREVAAALIAGTAGPELADRIEAVFDTTATPYWENRATVVARTETLGALNGGRADGQATMARRLGGEWERVWVATLDTRTRPTHAVADGQRIPLGGTFSVGGAQLRWPGDPLGPPEEVIQCRCTTVLVRPGQTIDIARRA